MLDQLVDLFDLIRLTGDNQAVGCLVCDDCGTRFEILPVAILHQRDEQLGDQWTDLGGFRGAQLENPQLQRFPPVVRVQLANHRPCRRHRFFGAGENEAVASLIHQQTDLTAIATGVETFLDQPGNRLGIGRLEPDDLRHPLSATAALDWTKHPDQSLNTPDLLLRPTDDHPIVLSIGENGRRVGLAVRIVAKLVLIQLAHRRDDLIRLANRYVHKFKLMRSQVLSSDVVVQRKLLDPLELLLGGDDHQAAARAVGNDLWLGAVRRNLVVEQVFCQLDQLLGVPILESQQPHLSFHRFRGCGNGGHDLFNDIELLRGGGHDQATARFVRQDHRPGQTGKFRVLHSLIKQLLDRLEDLVELARLPARQADRTHLLLHHHRPGGLVFLEECRDTTVLLPGGQNDQPLAAGVLHDLRCRPGAWLVVLKQPRDQWRHLACIGALEVHKPHCALRRVRKHVERLHHLRNHLVLLDVGSNNHPVVHPVLNQARLGMIAERCFPHPVVHQRLDVAINLVHLAVGQGQHHRRARLGQGLG